MSDEPVASVYSHRRNSTARSPRPATPSASSARPSSRERRRPTARPTCAPEARPRTPSTRAAVAGDRLRGGEPAAVQLAGKARDVPNGSNPTDGDLGLVGKERGQVVRVGGEHRGRPSLDSFGGDQGVRGVLTADPAQEATCDAADTLDCREYIDGLQHPVHGSVPHGATQRLGEHDDRHPEVQAELDRPMHRGSDPDIAPRPGDNGPRVEDHALRREDGSATLWSGHSRRTSSITCSGTGPYSSAISSSRRLIREGWDCTRKPRFSHATTPVG